MSEQKLSPGAKFAIDIGPLLIFGATYYFYDIFAATLAIVIATLITVGIGYAIEKKIAHMPLITAAVVTIFGGMAIVFNDPSFFYIKPTIVNALFGAILLGGIVTKKNLLQMLFEDAFDLSDDGWRILTIRWILFFFAMALLNEIVWRNFEEATWVSFKVFGFVPLTLLFTFAQVPLIMKHSIDQDETDTDEITPNTSSSHED